MYYIHKDYLGSYDVVTNQQGQVVEEYSFDPWGRRRNSTNWTYNNVPQEYLFDRGYTGHEHLDIFGLINMNGRVYDPWLGRFLSADPFIQNPRYSQSFNRYSYCFNNPLKFIDPTGYITLQEIIDDLYRSHYGGSWNAEQGFVYYTSHTDALSAGQTYSNQYTRTSSDVLFVAYEGCNNPDKGQYGRFENKLNDGPYVVFTATGDNQWGALVYNTENGEYETFGDDLFGSALDLVEDEIVAPWTWLIDVATGQEGLIGLSENNFIKYSIEGTSIWAGTIQTGFDATRKLQPTVRTWIKGAKVIGKTSNLLGVASIGYDFATGTANSSTIADGLVLAGGAAVIFFGGVALAPWVAGAGVLYGIVSIAGGEAWLDRNLDISRYLNIVKPLKP